MSTREVADYSGIVERDKCLIQAVAAFDLGQFAHAPNKLVSTRRGISALPGPRADKSSRENILTPAKQRAEQLHFVGWRLRYKCLKSKGRTYVDFRSGVERSQVGPERGESMPRLSQVSFKFGERQFLLRDGLLQRLSACPLGGCLASV
jgi:hypothetical protein